MFPRLRCCCLIPHCNTTPYAWKMPRRRRSQSPYRYHRRRRTSPHGGWRAHRHTPAPPEDSPALKSAKALLAVSAQLLDELLADLAAICLAVLTLCFPWKWGWVKEVLACKDQQQRRVVIRTAAAHGALDCLSAPSWAVSQVSWRRSGASHRVCVCVCVCVCAEYL